MALSLADTEIWEEKATKLENWAKDEPDNWIKANNKRFPFNKALGQRFCLHEIDLSIEPLKDFDDILRRLRWYKPDTADVMQQKYDEFFTNLREGYPLIQDADDCSWTVVVLRTLAVDLAKELREISKMAKAELTDEKPTDTEQDNELSNLDDIDNKIIAIYQEAEKQVADNPNGKLKLPGTRKIAKALYKAGITKKEYSHTAIEKRIQKLRKEGLVGHPDDNKEKAKRFTPEHIADMDGNGKTKQKF